MYEYALITSIPNVSERRQGGKSANGDISPCQRTATSPSNHTGRSPRKEWVVQLLRQGNSDVFKKYSQMKLTMKREALQQINRRANEMTIDEAPAAPVYGGFGTVLVQ